MPQVGAVKRHVILQGPFPAYSFKNDIARESMARRSKAQTGGSSHHSEISVEIIDHSCCQGQGTEDQDIILIATAKLRSVRNTGPIHIVTTCFRYVDRDRFAGPKTGIGIKEDIVHKIGWAFSAQTSGTE